MPFLSIWLVWKHAQRAFTSDELQTIMPNFLRCDFITVKSFQPVSSRYQPAKSEREGGKKRQWGNVFYLTVHSCGSVQWMNFIYSLTGWSYLDLAVSHNLVCYGLASPMAPSFLAVFGCMISNIRTHKSLNMFNHKLYPVLFLWYWSFDLIGLASYCSVTDWILCGLKDLLTVACIFMEYGVYYAAALCACVSPLESALCTHGSSWLSRYHSRRRNVPGWARQNRRTWNTVKKIQSIQLQSAFSLMKNMFELCLRLDWHLMVMCRIEWHLAVRLLIATNWIPLASPSPRVKKSEECK